MWDEAVVRDYDLLLEYRAWVERQLDQDQKSKFIGVDADWCSGTLSSSSDWSALSRLIKRGLRRCYARLNFYPDEEMSDKAVARDYDLLLEYRAWVERQGGK